jgi:hypothetical protein
MKADPLCFLGFVSFWKQFGFVFLRLSPLHFLGFVSFLNNLSLLFSEGGFRFFFETTWLRFFVKVEPLTFFCFVSFLKQFGSQ